MDEITPEERRIESLRHEATTLLDKEQPEVNAALSSAALVSLGFTVVAIALDWHGWLASIGLFFAALIGLGLLGAILASIGKSFIKGWLGSFLGWVVALGASAAIVSGSYDPAWVVWALAAGGAVTYFPLRVSAYAGQAKRLVALGLTKSTLELLAKLPETLTPTRTTAINDALRDFFEIRSLLGTQLGNDSAASQLSIEEAATGALDSMLARAPLLRDLEARALEASPDDLVHDHVVRARRRFDEAARELRQMATALMGYAATQDGEAINELRDRTEQLRFVAAAEEELEAELNA